MPKIIHMNPEVNRTGTSARQIDFKLNFNSFDNVTTAGTITLRVASKEDFSDASIVTPTTFSHKDAAGSVWTNAAGNSVSLALQVKDLRVDIAALAAESRQYVKVLFTSGGVTYESSAVLFTSLTEIVFNNSANSIIVGAVRPIKVRVMDRITAVLTSAFTIKVEVCNNLNDTTPIWENATSSYLSSDYHTFTNTTRVNANPWTIGVRYTIKKNNTTDTIEVSELFIAFV